MRPEKLKLAFERYRAEGDVRSLAQVFDAVAPELLQVARHLEGRAGEAEDLVQTTFLIAIQRAPSYDLARPLVPWLLGILVNQAHLARRRRGRLVPTSEERVLEGSTEAHDPATGELAEAVARALTELPQKYRDVLVAHLGEGKRPGEIAHDLGRPAGTVRAQLHRGLRLLRRALPAGLSLGWLAAILVPASLAEARREVLAAARRASAPRAPPAWSGPSRTLVRAAGLLALAGLGFWLWRPAPPEPALSAGSAPAALVHELAADTVLDAPGATRAPARAASAGARARDSARATSGELLLRVLHAELDQPAPEVAVTLLPWGAPDWYARVRTARTDARGEALLLDLPPGRVGVHLDGGPQTRATVEAGVRTVLALRLAPGLHLAGRVLDPAGAPARGARVELFARALDPQPRRTISCDAQGRFELDEADPAAWVAAAAPGSAPSLRVALERFMLSAAREGTLALALRPARAPLEVWVHDERGLALAGARLCVAAPGAPAPAAWRPDGCLVRDVLAREVACDAAGHALLDELGLGELVLRVTSDGCGLAQRTLEPAHAGPLALVLARAARVTGRVELGLAGGERVPAAGASVALAGAEQALSTRADEHGRFVLEGLPAGVQTLVARAAGLGSASEMELVLAPGEECARDLVVDPLPTIEGRVQGPGGKPVQIWLVRAVSLAPGETLADPLAARLEDNRDEALLSCWTDAEGRFRVPCLGPGPFRLELRPRGRWQKAAVAALAPLEPGAREVCFEVATSAPVGQGTLLCDTQPGAGFAEVFALARGFDGFLRAEIDPGTGRFELEGMAPGDWILYARAPTGPVCRIGERRIEGSGSPALGVLRLSEGRGLALAAEAPR